MKKIVTLLLLGMVASAGTMQAGAANIQWASWAGWAADAQTGSIAYKNGSVDVTVTGLAIDTAGTVADPFATTSANYQNIDTAMHNALRITPDNPNTTWIIEFDFVGTTLTSQDVFTISQLGVTATGVNLTDLDLEFYAVDDTSVIDPASLEFEQHAIVTPDFDAALAWDPSVFPSTLSPVADRIAKDSGGGFFSPTTSEVGRIVAIATTAGGPDAVDFSFGSAVVVPVPAGVILFGSGLLGLVGFARRRQ